MRWLHRVMGLIGAQSAGLSRNSGDVRWPIDPHRPDPAFPPALVERNALILPATRRRGKGRGADGGLVSDEIVRAEALLDQVPERLVEPAVWIGHLDRHFGHLMSEHLPCLPVVVQDHPDELYLFTADPGTDLTDVPGWFESLIGWYGLRLSQVRLITRPTLVDNLRRPVLAEALEGHGPSAEYLSVLDRLAIGHGLRPEPSDVLYIERTALMRAGRGAHAGERYLVQCLKKLGVRVLDPGPLPFRDQLAAYAGARHIVFAEGTAMHGRQGIGFVRQGITVLNRRPGERLARHLLEPRCETLSYAEATRCLAHPTWRDGHPFISYGISFYDIDALFAAFSAVGIKLRPVWNDRKFRMACREDVSAWIAGRRAEWPPALFRRNTVVMREILRKEGYGGLLARPAAASSDKPGV
jgi:Glycosyltransferase 61